AGFFSELLDDQLFGQFQRCADILGQTPLQAASREHLRELLNRASGGVVFTTVLQRPWKLTRQDLRQLKLALDQRGLSETSLATARAAA
ncbi:MAG TPA: hypothetical protein DDY43_02865, partial [Synechococcales bacterium UBA10510]|nr:hypothetical protein [Synechococcales bacterium UBA10510]